MTFRISIGNQGRNTIRTVGIAPPTDGTIGSAAFNKANSANIIADLAFDKANAANVLAYSTSIIANAAYNAANSAVTPPGGSANTVQYNISGSSFGGMSGTTWNDTFRSLTISGATLNSSNPIFNLSQTWNNAAVTFTALKLNVTDTASASGSLLLDLQVGGTSKLNVNKNGMIYVNNGATTTISGGGLAGPIGGSVHVGAVNGAVYLGSLSTFGADVLINGATGALKLRNALLLQWSSDSTSYGTADVILARDAANTLALRNSTSAQTLRIYKTYTDASNYEGLSFGWNASNTSHEITTIQAGTGSSRKIRLHVEGWGWDCSTVGHWLAVNDNLQDIGTLGANRPRNIYVGTSITAGTTVSAANLTASSQLYAGSAGYLGITTRFWFTGSADGLACITNQAGNDFGRIQFGGTTSSYPALKRSTTDLHVRLADDSAYSFIRAKLYLETAAAPASASDTGTAGEVRWDSSYAYICTATNTWKRAALATW